MLLLSRILLSALIIPVCWAFIRHKDIKINVIEDQVESFEEEVNRKIAKAMAFINGAMAVPTLTIFVPELLIPSMIVLDVLTIIRNRVMFDSISRSISEATERAIILNEVFLMHSRFQTVSQDLNMFQTIERNNDTLPLSDKSMTVKIMVNTLTDIGNIFFQRTSKFRDYPKLAVFPLTALTAVFAVVKLRHDRYSPTLSKYNYFACRLHDTLLEYRFLLVWSRIKDLQIDIGLPNKVIPALPSYEQQARRSLSQTIRYPYSSNGYNSSNLNGIHCERKGCRTVLITDWCLRDPFNSQEFLIDYGFSDTGYGTKGHFCITGYTKYLRYILESKFKDSVDIVSKICPDAIRKQRQVTGDFERLFCSSHSVNYN